MQEGHLSCRVASSHVSSTGVCNVCVFRYAVAYGIVLLGVCAKQAFYEHCSSLEGLVYSLLSMVAIPKRLFMSIISFWSDGVLVALYGSISPFVYSSCAANALALAQCSRSFKGGRPRISDLSNWHRRIYAHTFQITLTQAEFYNNHSKRSFCLSKLVICNVLTTFGTVPAEPHRLNAFQHPTITSRQRKSALGNVPIFITV